MVDREKIIKGLEICTADIPIENGMHRDDMCQKCPYHNEKYAYCFEKNKLMQDALAMLKEQEWHMLTEDDDGFIFGLPGDDGQYLMTDGKEIWIDDYIDGVDDGVWLDSGRDIREITAWMYMPEPPKGAEHD